MRVVREHLRGAWAFAVALGQLARSAERLRAVDVELELEDAVRRLIARAREDVERRLRDALREEVTGEPVRPRCETCVHARMTVAVRDEDRRACCRDLSMRGKFAAADVTNWVRVRPWLNAEPAPMWCPLHPAARLTDAHRAHRAHVRVRRGR